MLPNVPRRRGCDISGTNIKTCCSTLVDPTHPIARSLARSGASCGDALDRALLLREQHWPDAEQGLRAGPDLATRQIQHPDKRLSRVLEKLGLDRAMRSVESLASYLEAKRIDDAKVEDAEAEA